MYKTGIYNVQWFQPLFKFIFDINIKFGLHTRYSKLEVITMFSEYMRSRKKY